MNVTIVAVDRLRESYLRDGCALYIKRLAPVLPVERWMFGHRPKAKNRRPS